MRAQLTLFDDCTDAPEDLKTSRSGTFVDNMTLPFHRWFRYSAGFAAQWVEQVLREWGLGTGHTVLDPFAGSGTVPVVCETLGIRSVAVEAHPFVGRICKAKLLWMTPVEKVSSFGEQVLKSARHRKSRISDFPPLIRRSYDEPMLAVLDNLMSAWLDLKDGSPESELVWLALTAILRPTSKAGTAQWQYILPNKTKKKVSHPSLAFQQQLEMIKSDMRWMQSRIQRSYAQIVLGDARDLVTAKIPPVDAVITSPPYANNYDYADALRFEMTFWDEVNNRGDIHDAVRKRLIVSSSQHSSRERLRLEDVLASEVVSPIRSELQQAVEKLKSVREGHGGKKYYHTMVAAYCRDIAIVMQQLRQVCKSGSRICWVIGDSAPYGVYCPIDNWIGQLAMAAGFRQYRFEKLRDRNIKWKNRKHRVPLKEGLLWVDG